MNCLAAKVTQMGTFFKEGNFCNCMCCWLLYYILLCNLLKTILKGDATGTEIFTSKDLCIAMYEKRIVDGRKKLNVTLKYHIMTDCCLLWFIHSHLRTGSWYLFGVVWLAWRAQLKLHLLLPSALLEECPKWWTLRIHRMSMLVLLYTNTYILQSKKILPKYFIISFN